MNPATFRLGEPVLLPYSKERINRIHYINELLRRGAYTYDIPSAMAAMRAAGANLEDIAKRFLVSTSAVAGATHARGVKRDNRDKNGRPPSLSEAAIKNIIVLRETRMPVEEIAKAAGIRKSRVSAILKKHAPELVRKRRRA